MSIRACRKLIGLALTAALFGCVGGGNAAKPAEYGQRPNILIILADDLGFTDLGSFGGEIDTPNLDALAFSGLRLSNFHMAPTCAPSRGMLLSGTDNHLAGLGTQENLTTDNQRGRPGYEQHMTDRVFSVAALLRDGGYRTYMSGKWHLGTTPETSPGARGFQRWFALLQGGGSHFDKSGISPRDPVVNYLDQGVERPLPEDYYSSDFFTSQLIDMLAGDLGRQPPFFAYLSFTAPHWPLHAPDEVIRKYRGRYDAGYDRLRDARIAKATDLGVVERGVAVSPPVGTLSPWDDLTPEQKKTAARKMEVYAAMIDRLDWNVGRLIAFLEENQLRDNTLILFLSDNGAEGHLMEAYPSFVPWLAENYDNRYDNIGRKGSFASLGAGWAHAANGPFRLYKGFMSEGGTKVPGIVNLPGMASSGRIGDAYLTVMDIAPTLLEFAELEAPGNGNEGNPTHAMTGMSFAPLVLNHRAAIHPQSEPIAWEFLGRRAIQRGRWKLLWLEAPYGAGAWELFDMQADPGETNDLADEMPDIRDSLILDWENYAEENGVILPDSPIPY